jgi:hypothetical protein
MYKPYAYAIAPLYLISYIKNLYAYKVYYNAGLNFAKFYVYKAANIIAECLKERYSLLNLLT